MEGATHSGRWNKKAPFGTILLMCMFIPTLALLQPTKQVVTDTQPTKQVVTEQKCPHGDYLTEKGICCNKCSPGFKLVEDCQAVGKRSNCTPCRDGQYMDKMNYANNCFSCKRCKTKYHEIEVSKCEIYQNTICRCEDGYYKYDIDSGTPECRKCTKCGPDEKETKTCTPENNTVCECKGNYYRVNKKCVPCKNCTSECKDHCPTLETKAPEPPTGFLINVIAVVAVVALASLVLVALITYMTTKRITKKKLLESSSQPSDVSPDTLEVLIHEEPSDKSVKAVPQNPVSEQEPSNLPDCVPLEIKIPDLIYALLDLVPVLQVKQLVRSLGVTDTEIQRAEMDHRSCQEAHYQMLRVWAERGSRAGGRGRGRMLHQPLLLELLDKLREIHLGQAAEELETKYGIQ